MLDLILFAITAIVAIYVAFEIIVTIGDIITSAITLLGLGVGLLFIADLFGLVKVFDVSLQLLAPVFAA